MSSQSRWRSNVSFSDRLNNVFKMQVDFSYLYAPNLHRIIEVFFLCILTYPACLGSTSSYRAASVSVDVSQAQAEAKSIEDEAYKSAKSKVSGHSSVPGRSRVWSLISQKGRVRAIMPERN